MWDRVTEAETGKGKGGGRCGLVRGVQYVLSSTDDLYLYMYTHPRLLRPRSVPMTFGYCSLCFQSFSSPHSKHLLVGGERCMAFYSRYST